MAHHRHFGSLQPNLVLLQCSSYVIHDHIPLFIYMCVCLCMYVCIDTYMCVCACMKELMLWETIDPRSQPLVDLVLEFMSQAADAVSKSLKAAWGDGKSDGLSWYGPFWYRVESCDQRQWSGGNFQRTREKCFERLTIKTQSPTYSWER